MRKLVTTCTGLFALLVLPIVLSQTNASQRFEDEALAVGARTIVQGSVVSVKARIDETQQRVFTYVKLRVEEVFKGRVGGPEIVLKEEGGEAGWLGERVTGTPTFKVGERVIVYLDTWSDGSLRVYQLFLGKIAIEHDRETGESIARRAVTDTDAATLTRAARAQLASTRPIRAELYATELRQTVRLTQARSNAFAARYYRDTPLLEVPAECDEFDDTRDPGEWSTQSTLLPFPARWFEPDTGQSVTFFMNPDGIPGPAVVDDVAAALQVWTTAPATSLKLVNGGPQTVCSGINGVGVVVFNNCDGRFQAEEDCSRFLARGGMVWDNRITKEVNGQTYRKALRGFVAVNPFAGCSFDGHCDVREIITHEVGHALGLGHSQYGDATMFGSIHQDGRCATIKGDDARGLAIIYPPQEEGPKPLTITTTAVPGAVEGAHYIPVVEATGGVRPYTWARLPGFGHLPEGVTVDPRGVLVGPALETGTFSFQLEVGDSAGTTTSRQFTITVSPRSTEYNSDSIGQSAPAAVQAGQQFTAVLRWLNTGTRTWDPALLEARCLPSPNGESWGIEQVRLASPVPPGQPAEFLIRATAPNKPGAYDFSWQLSQAGIGLIGEPSRTLPVFVNAGSVLSIDTSSLPGGAVGVAYNAQLSAAGGRAPYAWSIASDLLPSGLSLNGTSGTIQGTPTVAGDFFFALRVADADARSVIRSLSISIAAAVLRIDSLAAAQATRGAPFSLQLSATGGSPPYTWSITGGALPSGVGLSSAGLISGTPSVSGSFQSLVTVRDQSGQQTTASFQMTVNDAVNAPVITSLKYKPGKRKLTVSVDRLEAQATLLVDGVAVAARSEPGLLIAKKLTLSPGQHEAKVMNPGGVTSAPAVFVVP